MANLLISGRPLWKRGEQRKTKKRGRLLRVYTEMSVWNWCCSERREVKVKMLARVLSASKESKQEPEGGRGDGGVYITGMSHFLRWRSAVCAHNVHRAIRASGIFFPFPLQDFMFEKHILSRMQPIPRGLLHSFGCLKRILGQN